MKKLHRENLFISTIDPDASTLAIEFNVGLEIAEYCTAYNMDQFFDKTHSEVLQKINGVANVCFHAPFNELFPCAIDPKARELAADRYRQAMALAGDYGANKIIIHSGYAPMFYYDCWFEEQSILFWKRFLHHIPDDMVVCLENVLETQPEPLLHILEAVQDPKLRICLDIGHSNAYSERPVEEWLRLFAPYIAHFHIHNNMADRDSHGHLFEGSIKMKELLTHALELCPDATFTLEIPDSKADLVWLREEGIAQL